MAARPNTMNTSEPMSVRPKAFRRPPAWVAPLSVTSSASSTTSLSASSERNRALVAQHSEVHAVPSHSATGSDRLFGFILITSVVIVNVLVMSALNAWQSHIQPRYQNPADHEGLKFIQTPDVLNTGDITLYSTPMDERRTVRNDLVDFPLDSTDAIDLSPANPDYDQQ
jgi:hypothetical protein